MSGTRPHLTHSAKIKMTIRGIATGILSSFQYSVSPLLLQEIRLIGYAMFVTYSGVKNLYCRIISYDSYDSYFQICHLRAYLLISPDPYRVPVLYKAEPTISRSVCQILFNKGATSIQLQLEQTFVGEVRENQLVSVNANIGLLTLCSRNIGEFYRIIF